MSKCDTCNGEQSTCIFPLCKSEEEQEQIAQEVFDTLFERMINPEDSLQVTLENFHEIVKKARNK